jgi:hypothetical protein
MAYSSNHGRSAICYKPTAIDIEFCSIVLPLQCGGKGSGLFPELPDFSLPRDLSSESKAPQWRLQWWREIQPEISSAVALLAIPSFPFIGPPCPKEFPEKF